MYWIYTDIFMLKNVAWVVLWLLMVVIAKGVFNKKVYGEGLIIPFAFLAYGVLTLNDKLLEIAFWFSVSAGAMQILADGILTDMTLSYPKKSWKIHKTPWWMTILWIVALTQLSYLCLRLYSMELEINTLFSIFIPISFLYFLAFEVVVNNFTDWWSRRNCWQVFNVAVYALIAELLTCAFIPIFLDYFPIIGTTKALIWESLVMGFGAGIFIFSTFYVAGLAAYLIQRGNREQLNNL